MKTLYLDVFSGISGDMFLGAMLDLGVDFEQLDRELKKLGLDGYHLHASRRQNSHIEGIKFDVHLEGDHHHEHGHVHAGHEAQGHNSGRHRHQEDEHHHEHEHGQEHGHEHEHPHSGAHGHDDSHEHEHGQDRHEHQHEHPHEHGRTFADIRQLISHSGLSPWVKEKSIAVFQRVAAAEGKIHGLPSDEVHFHEVGAIDSIVDIVGACIALELLGKPRVLSAPVVEGTGWVNCAHGRFPVPTAATLEILGARGVGLTQCDEPSELVTPTGAALLAEFAQSFGPMQGLIANQIGYGLGTRQNKTRPNVLRAILAEVPKVTAASGQGSESKVRDWEMDTIAVLETNLDDIKAEVLGNVVERALAAGALDVFYTSIQMKKNRPGVLLTVLCPASDADEFSEFLVRETSAFGVRRSMVDRQKLRRETITAQTPFGEITIKLGRLNGQIIQAKPEFESCRKLAEAASVPIKRVYEAADLVCGRLLEQGQTRVSGEAH